MLGCELRSHGLDVAQFFSFDQQEMLTCNKGGRVTKYHRYGRYICVKYWKEGGKILAEHAIFQNQAFLRRFVQCMQDF